MLEGRFEYATIGVKFILLFFLIILLSSFDIIVSLQTQNPEIIQWVGLFTMFILPALIGAYLFSRSPIRYLCLDKIPTAYFIGFSIALYICSYPAISFIGVWNDTIDLPESMAGIEKFMRELTDLSKTTLDQIIHVDSIGRLISVFLLISIMTGIGEELLFRGVIQRILFDRFKNAHLAVWITAVVFSAIHFQFFGFLPLLLMGAFLGYLLVWSRSIYVPMIMHALNNGIAVILEYLNYKNIVDLKSWEDINTDTPTFQMWAMVSVISTVLLIIYLKRFSHKPVLSGFIPDQKTEQ